MRSHVMRCAALFLALACGRDVPLAPPGSVTLEQLSPAEVADLRQQEQAELARIEERRLASDLSADSLKALWKSFNTDWDSRGALVLCIPRQYDGAARIVGPEGGVLDVGSHRLTIPPGALDRPVVITAESPVAFEVMLEFKPHGLTFRRRPTLTFDYTHCLRPSWLQERVAYLGADDEVLEWPESHDRTTLGRIDARIDHFSRYAVAF